MSSILDRDQLGAFVQDRPVDINPTSSGSLDGLTFAVKDLYDIAGVKTGAGNPDWLETHDAPTETASSIRKLLGSGAHLVGKTLTDELAYSINGQNHHYGTPVNVAAPGRIPGGSSNGSASAVAGKLVDFTLGTDTGGSVRIPASYCGLYGIRPTHGRVPTDGIVPLSPSFDVAGWFTRSAKLFADIGDILLPGEDAGPLSPKTILLPVDAFDQIEPAHHEALKPAINDVAEKLGCNLREVNLSGNQLADWFFAFRQLQCVTIWETHRDWIKKLKPSFGPGIKERFEIARDRSEKPELTAMAKNVEKQVIETVGNLMDENTIIMIPTSAGVAPLPAERLTAMDAFRERAMNLTTISGFSRTPQITIPAARLTEGPVGLSLIAGRGKDKGLLALARKLDHYDVA